MFEFESIFEFMERIWRNLPVLANQVMEIMEYEIEILGVNMSVFECLFGGLISFVIIGRIGAWIVAVIWPN